MDKNTTDAVTSAVGVAIYLQTLTTTMQAIAAIGAGILVWVRVALAVREWLEKRRKKEETSL